MSPDDQRNARDSYFDDRKQKLDARERLLDAREHRLTFLEQQVTERADRLDEQERVFAERELGAEQRDRTADERDAIADTRDQHATTRERALDGRAATNDPARTDPMDQIQGTFAREVARLDRSDAFLHRSRDAVQRAQERLDKLRASAQNQLHRIDPSPGEDDGR
ncbi:MAG TPA: hypothetical protein VN408_02810 [Actinoplanes sp.]|nr:hypothetical protein [Actinoplanes sp.]